jgi:hypothetical protein
MDNFDLFPHARRSTTQHSQISIQAVHNANSVVQSIGTQRLVLVGQAPLSGAWAFFQHGDVLCFVA